jgi:hypothetical protein
MTQVVMDRPDSFDLSPVGLGALKGVAGTRRALLWDRLRGLPSAKPASCPWGAIIDAFDIAPGIIWFKTPSRGGYRLSARRQSGLPRYLRTEDGWYEDLSEWAAVAVVFHRIFDKMPAGGRATSLYEVGKETLKNWKPEEYERWFQSTLDMDEIWSLAIMKFHRVHADRWIALDVVDDRALVPAGHLHVRAKQGGDPPYSATIGAQDSPSRWFLVGADEFAQKRGAPFLIDHAKHREIGAPDVDGDLPP